MPFKSEKQRRYLWANEPEIARDWTDTYGSKIHKADGGRIGFRVGGGKGMSETEDTGMPVGGSGANYGGGNTGGEGRSRIQRERQADFKANPKNYKTVDRGGNLPNRTGILGNTIHNISNFYRDNIYDRRPYDLKQRQKFLAKKGLFNLDPVLDEDEYGDPRYSDSDWLTSREGLEHLWGLGYTGGKINPADDRGQEVPYIYPYETASAPIEEEEIVETDPINLYAGSYRVRPEYLLAEGGRVPAAYGGIMDTYTGRRKYGFGSFISKPFKAAKKAVKKLTSSPIGKLALLGGLGYLATPGTGASIFSPEGKGKWWKKLLMGAVDKGGVHDTSTQGLFSKGLKALKNPWVTIPGAATTAGLYTAKQPVEDLDDVSGEYDEELAKWEEIFRPYKGKYRVQDEYLVAEGGRIGKQEGGIMDLGGVEKDYRNDGGFVPLGEEEKADDVPARLSKNEFVFTADAVRAAGGGDIDAGAEVMQNMMENLEAGGEISPESQGAQGMYNNMRQLETRIA